MENWNEKSLKWWILTIIAIGCICLYILATKSLNRGIDLAGGMQFTIEVLADDLSEDKRKEAIDKTLAVYRNRIDEFGIAGTTIQHAGGNRIIVQIPGVETKEADRIKGILMRQAHLEFKLVIDGPGEPIIVN